MNAIASVKTVVPQLLNSLTRLTSAGEVITAQDWEYGRRVRDLVDGIVERAREEGTGPNNPFSKFVEKEADDISYLSNCLWRAGIYMRQLEMHHVETLRGSTLDAQRTEEKLDSVVGDINLTLQDLAEEDPLFLAGVTHFNAILPDLLQPISLSPEAVLERDWGKVMEEAAKAVNPPPSRPRP